MKNISAYNFNLFDVNNNYVQYLVSDYDDKTAVLNTLNSTDNIDEALEYHEFLVQEMYFVDETEVYSISSDVNAVNTGILSPKLVTLPDNKNNFYLFDQIIAGLYPRNPNEILVSSEFILTRFFEFSLDEAYNPGVANPVNSLNNFIGDSLYICGETILDQSEISIVTIDQNCQEFIISGVLNSFYNGINYTGKIFVRNEYFDAYIEKMRAPVEPNGEGGWGFTRVDEYYDTYISFYLEDFDKGIGIGALSLELDATVTNNQLREYNETRTLEVMLDYIYIAIFVSLIIISGTIDINIVASSVTSRIKEIGIYSCIGVSKKSIRNMFVFETLEIAIRILLINSTIFVGIAFGFKLLYKNIVVDLTIFEEIFGVNEMFSYEIYFSALVILGAVVFLFASVLIPSFRAANMRAIDALRSE